MSELKPCPFCGTKYVGVLKGRRVSGVNIYKVRCENTQCDVMPETIWFDDEEQKAIEAWNRRAET